MSMQLIKWPDGKPTCPECGSKPIQFSKTARFHSIQDDGMKIAIEPYYSGGGITIYNADCRKVLPWLEPFDLLLTDPPYGLGVGQMNLGKCKAGIAADFPTMSSWRTSRMD